MNKSLFLCSDSIGSLVNHTLIKEKNITGYDHQFSTTCHVTISHVFSALHAFDHIVQYQSTDREKLIIAAEKLVLLLNKNNNPCFDVALPRHIQMGLDAARQILIKFARKD